MGEATIRDVARRAEVSVASVSRALNGHLNVHPDTRAKVLAAAEELRYVPHAGARSLSMARAHAIGVVLPDLHGEFFSEVVRGMDREANARGYQLLLSNMHADVRQAGHAMRAMRGRVDGLLVMAPGIAAGMLDEMLPTNIPSVLINSPDPGADRSSFRIDNAAGVDVMMAHLVETGRRHIVHVAGPRGNHDGDERAAAFRAAMARLQPDAAVQVLEGDFTEEAGEAAARALLDGNTPFDAIFAANDMMALGALRVLRDGGVDVPGTVAVAGFDDVPLARYLALTTVSVHMAEIGERAVGRLIDGLDGGKMPTGIEMVSPELVIRQTTM